MKTCRTCGELKPLSDFYKHANMRDGHLNQCRACVTAAVMTNRRKKPKAPGKGRKKIAHIHQNRQELANLMIRVLKVWGCNVSSAAAN